jgi:uncharacterized protein
MRTAPLLVGLAAALSLCRCAREDSPVPRPREAAVQAEHASHAGHEPPLAELTAAAEAGDVEAQVALGRLHLRGSAQVPADAGQARAWFLRAEAARPGSGAYDLGRMSQSGKGGPADPVEAVRWFELAAEAGSPDAMFLLANAARTGAGMPRDDARAIALYQRAAAMEHPESLQALALAHLHGELGLAIDESESRRYMTAAGHALQHHHR